MLIEELGESYAEEALVGTFFLYNGKPARIRGVTHSSVMLEGLDDVEGEMFEADPSEFTGWKTLKYPRLGYRHLTEGLWCWLTRTPRSYARGLNVHNVSINATAYRTSEEGDRLTRSAIGMDFQDFRSVFKLDYESRHDAVAGMVMSAALSPRYDGKDGLRKMFEGKAKCFIPSPRFLVEPKAGSKNLWNVFTGQTLLGTIDKDMKVRAPAKNVHIIASMVSRYAS